MFAVVELLKEAVAARAGRHISLDSLLVGEHKAITMSYTLATASDGNHGAAVAWAAQMLGCRSAVFLHENVSESRVECIRERGAVVTRVKGSYEDSVRLCAQRARQSGWFLVQDVSW